MNNWFENTQSNENEVLTIDKLNDAIGQLPKQLLLNGLTIYQNPYLMDNEEITIKRTMKDRLFTLPWNPFKKTKIETKKIPSTKIFGIKNQLTNEDIYYCHPLQYKEIITLLNNESCCI